MSVPTKQLLKSLVLTLLVPLILGKVIDIFLCRSLKWNLYLFISVLSIEIIFLLVHFWILSICSLRCVIYAVIPSVIIYVSVSAYSQLAGTYILTFQKYPSHFFQSKTFFPKIFQTLSINSTS